MAPFPDTQSVFYAWQSDSFEKHNRWFIEKALKGCLKQIATTLRVENSPRFDSDTAGEAGMPAIAETILEKIRAAVAMVVDLTFTGLTPKRALRVKEQRDLLTSRKKMKVRKLCSNSNVLIEMGHGAEALGWDRIVAVMNTYFGPPKHLPFDIKHRRFPITYSLSPEADADERSKVRAELTSKLKTALTLAFDTEHAMVDRVVRQLDIQCVCLCQLFGPFEHFPDIGSDDFIPEEHRKFFSHANFRYAVTRLLELSVLYTDVQGPHYAYHWTWLGKRVVSKLLPENGSK